MPLPMNISVSSPIAWRVRFKHSLQVVPQSEFRFVGEICELAPC